MTQVSTFAHQAPYDARKPTSEAKTAAATTTSSRGAFMRVAAVVAAVTFSLVHLSAASEADASVKRFTSIPAQNLDSALETLAKERNFQILYRSEIVGQLQTSGAAGELTTQETLDKLLSGTGLTYRYLDVDQKAVTIVPVGSPGAAPASTPSASSDEREGPQSISALRPSLWERLRLAQTSPSPASRNGAQGADESQSGNHSASDDRSVKLQEIVVTAQKRVERLLDVPVPVTAISAETLISNNQMELKNYYTRIPGLNLTRQQAYDGSVISIRGISTGGFNEGTTTVVIDDVPYSSSAQFGDIVPEVDPGDLARIEVLRGPQGTLYGASSMGGLLKYVTGEPSLEKLSGQLHGGLYGIYNGDGIGHYASGALNMPLGDSFAVRASAFKRRTPGYIDDPAHDIDGVNWATIKGARLATLWRPSDNFSLKLGALIQDSETGGNTYVDTEPGSFDRPEGLIQHSIPGSGGADRKLRVYTADLNANLGSVELTSVSAYVDNHSLFSTGGAFAGGFVIINPSIASTKFTEELRLAIPFGERASWRIGAFYSDEDSHTQSRFNFVNRDTGEMTGALFFVDFPVTYRDYAGFSDLTYRFTDRFDVQIGGRFSHRKHTSPHSLLSGALIGGGTLLLPGNESQDDAFTYLLAPRFKVSHDLMVYARLASGYRPGGPNANRGAPGVPPSFEPDKTLNYELGLKGELWDHLLSIDTSVYYIDWQNMRLANLFTPPPNQFVYTGNVGAAKSQGVEFALQLRPHAGTTLAATGAWSEAVLTEDFPATGTTNGHKGDWLPFNPRFSGSLSIDQEFPFAGNTVGYVGTSVSYQGRRRSGFPNKPDTQFTISSFVNTDFHAGVKRSSWDVNLYANNVFDRRSVLSTAFFGQQAFFIYVQPRTVGLSATLRF